MKNNNLKTSKEKGKGKSTPEKIKAHKTEICIAATVVVGIALSYVVCRKMAINQIANISANPQKLNFLRNTALEQANQCVDVENIRPKFYNVSGHPRALLDGQRASQKQIDIAKKLNVALSDNQTYVIEHNRKVA